MIRVPFGELRSQFLQIEAEIRAALEEVFESGWFVLGHQVAAFEQEFASYCGARYAVGVGSGTEALHLALIAAGVQPGDHVLTVPNTAVPTASAISFAGAIPTFAEVEPETGLMDLAGAEAALTPRTRALVPVHLYGQPVDLGPLLELARRYRLPVVEDAAQAHGASYQGGRIGSHGELVAFSFYPSKNLGAYGDGGAVTTNDESLRDQLVMLRNYGQRERYHHQVKGFNSRLDELQAAVLRVKLRHLDRWNARRQSLAMRYLSGIHHPEIRLPAVRAGRDPCWHLFVIQTGGRDDLRQHLERSGIGTQIHYPIPVHRQAAYAELGLTEGSLPIAESRARRILSLPLYPEMTDEQLDFVIDHVNAWEGPPCA